VGYTKKEHCLTNLHHAIDNDNVAYAWCMMRSLNVIPPNIQPTTTTTNTLFTHAASGSDKNELKHVREIKNVRKKETAYDYHF